MLSRGLKATWDYLDAIVEILVEDRAAERADFAFAI